MAAKVHTTLRLDPDVAQAVEAWARDNGMGKGAAVEALLKAAIDVEAGTNREGTASNQRDAGEIVALLEANVADLRAQVSTLTEQIAVKDEQIRGLMDIADHAQTLHAADVRALMSPVEVEGKPSDVEPETVQDEPEDAEPPADEQDGPQDAKSTQRENERPAGLWARIKRALMGY